ncbi:hypothetical protein NQ315_016329 [Exocentrus adspersus]|uniref:pseudouridine 5'-phosphatase n=1 Tax=Exocentrus adspersus TaxID=1586481 RepID=A0AAV8VQQ2_9CUCU|nr:hypothetical protein NQ315_016329 [Exocentrus adspersus]
MNCAGRFKKVTHVIFDLDGVLLDSEHLYTQGVQNVVGRYGKVYDWSSKMSVMGLLGSEAARKIIQLLDLPITAEEFCSLIRVEYDALLGKAELIPDTEIVYKSVIAGIAKRFGKVYTPEIQGRVTGTVERESCRIAVTEMKLPIAVDDFQVEFRTTAHRQFHNVALMPGAVNVVKHLHNHKIPIAVATSSSQKSFDLKTAKHKDLFKLFSHVVCGGSDPEVKEGKPKPDIFLVCASRFADKPMPEKCLVFEDAPNGVKAAVSAGMQVVMIPDENIPEELRKEAHVVVNGIERAPLDLFGLPKLTC